MHAAQIVKDHPLPWSVATSTDQVFEPLTRSWYAPYDDCVVDANGVEVLGSSEWMNGGEALPFIVECVNRVGEQLCKE